MAKIEARAHLLTFLINTTLGYECIANSIFKHSLHLTGRLTSLCLVFTVPVLSTLLYLKRMLSYDRSESVPMTAYTAPQIKARHPVNRRAFCSSITAASAATRIRNDEAERYRHDDADLSFSSVHPSLRHSFCFVRTTPLANTLWPQDSCAEHGCCASFFTSSVQTPALVSEPSRLRK
jgi:hypothetical protein